MPQATPPQEVVENWNRVFDALSTGPRRRLLFALLDAEDGEAIPLPDAAVSPDRAGDLERLRTNLYHRHLPALADHEFVEWDDDPMVARRGPRFDEVQPVLELVLDNPDQLPASLVDGCTHLELEQQPSDCDAE